MKLFTKTLLFFIGVVAFQSVLTYLFVTNAMRRADQGEARRELAGEAALLLDAFNSWKRQLWISLIRMGRDERLTRHLERGAPTDEELSAPLVELLYTSKADCLVLAGRDGGAPRLLTAGLTTLDSADVGRLRNRRTHPYLEFQLIRDTLYLVGATALPGPGAGVLDAYLIKRIDQELCAQLTLGRRSLLALYLGGRYHTGSFQSPPPWVFDSTTLARAYLDRYNERVNGGRYNIVVQWAGTLGTVEASGEEVVAYTASPNDLFLGVFLSNDLYAERILHVSRVVLLVSLAGGLLTIGLSLFLSRNITHPVAELVAGMERIAGGVFDIRVPLRGGPEMGRLYTGLNDMARELHQRREAMQEHIRETTQLKVYNERVIDSIRAGIAIVGRDLVVEKANDTFLQSFHLVDRAATGRPIRDLDIEFVDADLLSAVLSIQDGRRESHTEIKRLGDERVFEIKLYPFYAGPDDPGRACVLVAEDITARTELEHKIFQAEKLSTITMLSAGMAHEINNPIGSILSNTQNLLATEPNEERLEALHWIESEARRVARIVQELLRFAAPDSAQTPGAEAITVIQDVVRLVDSTLGKEDRIQISTVLGDAPLCTVLSPDELKQVTINLLKNSIQAIEGTGRITITARPRGGRLALAVADTGRGIPKAVLPRIFDPFFTTKANGVGTGLGLSVVYGIVTKHGGTIRVTSRVGAGTRVSLELPLETEK